MKTLISRQLLFLFPLFFCSQPGASAQEFGPSRTGSAGIDRIAVSPRNPDRIVALYNTAPLVPDLPGRSILARSLDGGVSSEVIATSSGALGGRFVLDVAYSRSGVLWVTAEDAVFKSADNGATLSTVFSLQDPKEEIFDVTVSPFDPDAVWISGRFTNSAGGSVIRSSDEGDTWTALPAVPGTVGQHTSLVLFDAAAPDRVVLRVGARIYRSEDGGQSFPFVGGTVFFGTARPEMFLHRGRLYHSSGPGNLIVSDDDGVTPVELLAHLSLVSFVAQNAIFPDRLALLTHDYRLLSNDGGQTWFQYDADDTGLYRSSSLAIAPNPANTAGVSMDDFLLGSVVGLAKFGAEETVTLGVPFPRQASSGVIRNPHSLTRVDIDPEDKNRWVEGRLLSEDRGLTWAQLPVSQLELLGRTASRFGADGDIIVSTNAFGGHVLIRKDQTVVRRGVSPGPRGGFITPLHTDSDVLVAAARASGAACDTLELSLDGGDSWSQIDECGFVPGFAQHRFDPVGIRPSETGFSIIRTNVLDEFLAPFVTSIGWSDDAGATWRDVPLFGSELVSFTVNDNFPQVVYASSSDGNSAVLRTIDGGLTWSPVGQPGNYGALGRGNLDPNLVMRNVLQGGDTGDGAANAIDVELSRDGGQTWTSVGGPNGIVGVPVFAPDDSYVVVAGRILELGSELGSPECMANPNATGVPGVISAVGSNSAQANDVTLVATDLPMSTFGIFVTSMDAGFIPNLAGGDGNLCLSGEIGRLQRFALQASAIGVMSARVDTAAVLQGNQLVAIQAGDTWRFQAWFRDGMTSNLTNAVAIQFVQ